MKNFSKMALGILTSVGGYLEVGSIGTAIQAGARFRYQLLWSMVLGTICIAFLCEMTGRLAAVSKHTLVDAVRDRFGFNFQVVPIMAQALVDYLVLAAEVGGCSLALQFVTGVNFRVWAIPVAFLLWLLLWKGTFGMIENGVAILGLLTLCFVLGVFRLHPQWKEIGSGFLPALPGDDRAGYLYLAVSILGATISPYLISFYSSGAVEEKWKESDLSANRIVSAIGMSFGSFIGMAVLIGAALALQPRHIDVDHYEQAALMLNPAFHRWGFYLFAASLFIGCFGAALELSLDMSYLFAQALGWNWGEDLKPEDDARFCSIYTLALPLATLPTLLGADPLKFTMFSMSATVIVLPVLMFPLLIVMNDKRYLKEHTNGWISNTAVVTVVGLGFILALVAIPLQILGGG